MKYESNLLLILCILQMFKTVIIVFLSIFEVLKHSFLKCKISEFYIHLKFCFQTKHLPTFSYLNANCNSRILLTANVLI